MRWSFLLFEEYVAVLECLVKNNEKIKKQILCLQALNSTYAQERFQVGQEYELTYDISELTDEYSWKIKKCQYFLDKYLQGILKELESISDLQKDNCITTGRTYFLDEAIYNFDAFVLASSEILEGESIGYMTSYLRRTPVSNYYPKKAEIGLYWQLNLLRNRIIHHTGGRYDNSGGCYRYCDFSSRINVIRFENGHIKMECTQIDVYRSSEVQNVILSVMKNGDKTNVFDCLFPEKSGKGHSKKTPGVLYPGITLYFDHVTSGIRFVSEIQEFILNMNEAFFVELSHCIKSKELIPEVGIICYEAGKEISCKVKEVFDVDKIPTC